MSQVELLAPAGNFEIFEAVLHAGADAVYLAGTQYGARAYAGNLNDEELLLAIEEAHVYGKKLYLTVNTLCKDEELKGLYQYILPLYEVGLDGVIIQDVGVLAFLNEHFPGLELHASTQMTITNSDFIPFLKQYNVTRIVPARELSLEEIKKLHDVSGMEIEAFVHGALCYCYSGACFMSSFMGGRSGNRGRCAQPCRLSYKKDGISKNILSLKDLRTLDILPDLIENGVYSMKIEGRMKSAEYAAGITEIYRKYIDLYLGKGREGYRVDPSDLEHLLLLFDRGGTTTGYYTRHNGAEMIANETKSDKSQAEKKAYEEGVITRNVRGDYRLPIDAHLSIHIGQPTILILTMQNRNVTICVEGNAADVAMKRAMTEEDLKKQICKMGDSFYKVFSFTCDMDDNLFIPNGTLNELRREAVIALTREICAPFRRDGLARPENIADPNTLPAFFEIADKKTENDGRGCRWSVHCMTSEQAMSTIEYWNDMDDIALLNSRLILDTEFMSIQELQSMSQKAQAIGVKVYLGGPRIKRDRYDSFFIHALEKLEPYVEGVLARSIGQIAWVKEYLPKKKIITDYTCYGLNQRAVAEISGFSEQIVSQIYGIEGSMHELKKLSLKHPELMIYGRVPLMVSANCVDRSMTGCHNPKERFTQIVDRKNAVLPVLTCCRYCYNLIFNSVPLFLADKKKELEVLPKDYLGIHFTTESAFEVLEILQNVQDETSLLAGQFTRGHFMKGVE